MVLVNFDVNLRNMPTLAIHKRHHFTGHRSAVYALASGTHAAEVLSCGGDGLVAAWDVRSGGDARLVATVPTQVFSLLHLEGYGLLAAGQMHGGIHIVDLLKGAEVRHLSHHTGSVYALCYDALRQQLWSGGGDGAVAVWSVPDFRLLHTITLSKNNIRILRLAPDGNTVLAGCSGNYVHILDAATSRPVQQWEAHTASVFSIAHNDTGNWLYTGSRDAYLKMWDTTKNHELYHAVPAHLLTINDLVYLHGMNLLASAGRDKHVKVWDPAQLALLKVIDHERLQGHTHSVNRLWWMPDAQCLVSASDDKTVQVWAFDND